MNQPARNEVELLPDELNDLTGKLIVEGLPRFGNGKIIESELASVFDNLLGRLRNTRATLPTPVEDGNLKEIRGRRDEIKVTLIAKPNIHEVRVGYYQDGQWFTIAKCSTFEADEEVYARFFVNAPTDIDYLLTRLSKAEAERAAYARANDEFGWLDICEFCEKSISEGDGTFNVCGRCWNAAVATNRDTETKLRDEVAELTAQVESLRQVLNSAQEAINSLPNEALGRDNQMGYFYKDELLANIKRVLAAATEGKK